MATQLIRQAVSLAMLIWPSTQSRVKLHSEIAVKTEGGGDELKFNQGDLFVCVEKWKKGARGILSLASSKDGHTCLATLSEVRRAQIAISSVWLKGGVTPPIRIAKNVLQCQATGEDHQAYMKACPMKGKEDVRLSYVNKEHLPKACFCKNYDQVMKEHLDEDTLALSFVKVLKTKYACDQMKETTSQETQRRWEVCTNSLYAAGTGSASASKVPDVKADGRLTEDDFVTVKNVEQLDQIAEAEQQQGDVPIKAVVEELKKDAPLEVIADDGQKKAVVEDDAVEAVEEEPVIVKEPVVVEKQPIVDDEPEPAVAVKPPVVSKQDEEDDVNDVVVVEVPSPKKPPVAKTPEKVKAAPELDEHESDDALIDVVNAIQKLVEEEDKGATVTESQFFDIFDKVCHSEEQLSRCGGHEVGSEEIKNCMDGCCLRACSKYWYTAQIPTCVRRCVSKHPRHLLEAV